MIVKRAPQRDVFRCLAAFGKETDAYCTLVPLMRQVRAYIFHRLLLSFFFFFIQVLAI